MGFPTEDEIKKFLANVKDDDFSIVLPKDASKVDRLKYNICAQFISYALKNKVSQAEIARMVNVDRSRINWIMKYRIEHFTIDYLYNLLLKLNPDTEIIIQK